jgi:hypothetical protein
MYKQSGTTLPFNLWLGKMKSEHGADFVKKFSMGNIEREIAPEPVVVNYTGGGVVGTPINTNTIIVVGGLLVLGYCWYKMNKN